MSNKLIKNVLNLLPGYGHISNVFYHCPVDRILFGYAYSRQSDGIQSYLYMLPLYTRAEFLHLGFSVALPRRIGHISITNKIFKNFLGQEGKYTSADDPGVASDFVQACNDFKQDNFPYEENIEGFIHMLQKRAPGYVGTLGPIGISVRDRLYILAASLALSGDKNSAIGHLESLLFDRHAEVPTSAYIIQIDHGKRVVTEVDANESTDSMARDPMLEDAVTLLNKLYIGLDAAKEWLDNIANNNRLKFKLK